MPASRRRHCNISRFCSSGVGLCGFVDVFGVSGYARGIVSARSSGSANSSALNSRSAESRSSSISKLFPGFGPLPLPWCTIGVDSGKGDTEFIRPCASEDLRSPRAIFSGLLSRLLSAMLRPLCPTAPSNASWLGSSFPHPVWWECEWPAPRVVRYDSKDTTTRADTIAISPGKGL